MSQQFRDQFDSLNLIEKSDQESTSTETQLDSTVSHKDKISRGKILTQLSILRSERDDSEKESSNAFQDANSEEEQKETSLDDNTCKPSLKRKREVDFLHEQLKMMKQEAEEAKNSGLIHIKLKTQRKYTKQAKTEAVEIVKIWGASRTAAQTGIPETTLRRWSNKGTEKLGQSGRKPQFTDIEVDLFAKFQDARSKGILVNNNYLLQEARNIAKAKGIQHFIGTLSWLDKFKQRHNIGYRRNTHVGQKLKPGWKEELKQFQKSFMKLNEKHHYPLEAIWNIDETGITYDNPSNYTLEIKGNIIINFN